MNVDLSLQLRNALLWAILLLPLSAMGEDGVSRIMDMGMAKEYCDDALLDDIEGVWHYVEDDVKVLVKKRDLTEGVYDMIVVETPDCRLRHGEKIGSISVSADASMFRMEVFTSRKKDILSDLGECLAVLSKDKDALLIQPKKLKIRMRSLSILPRFWRMIRISVDNPLDKLPRGVVRIYPAYDGNGSSRRQPRYL